MGRRVALCFTRGFSPCGRSARISSHSTSVSLLSGDVSLPRLMPFLIQIRLKTQSPRHPASNALAVAVSPHPQAIVIGGALSMSSSAFVLQLLKERGEMATRFGSATLGILLLQVGGGEEKKIGGHNGRSYAVSFCVWWALRQRVQCDSLLSCISLLTCGFFLYRFFIFCAHFSLCLYRTLPWCPSSCCCPSSSSTAPT